MHRLQLLAVASSLPWACGIKKPQGGTEKTVVDLEVDDMSDTAPARTNQMQPVQGVTPDEPSHQLGRRHKHVRAALRHDGKEHEMMLRGAKTKPSEIFCLAVSKSLQGRNNTHFATQLWNTACHDVYNCPTKLPELKDGCLIVPTDDHLLAVFDRIGTPNPCALNAMFINSFFTDETCDLEKGSLNKKVQGTANRPHAVSRGGVHYKPCAGGMLTHNTDCAQVSRTTKEREIVYNLDVFLIDGVIGLPKAWESAMLRAPNYDTKRATTREHMISNVAHVSFDPSVELKFTVCGSYLGDNRARLLESLRKQVDVLVGAHQGQSQCAGEGGATYPHPTGIKWSSNFSESNVTFITDPRCSTCDESYRDIWDTHMPEERAPFGRFKGAVLKRTLVQVLVCQGQGTLLGAASLPWEQVLGSMIKDVTLPGGSFEKHNTGRMLVRQLGTYFGLLNTFEGGCAGPNTGVANHFAVESPMALRPHFGCPKPQDLAREAARSCGNTTSGTEYVNNFMDLMDDECSCTFTKDQKKRMRTKARKYIYHKG